MLIELWERLRGYDKWIETEATVESSDVEDTAHADRAGHVSHTYAAREALVWRDSSGQKRRVEFRVDDESPLYQLIGGEAVTIRVNPARPSQYYFRDLFLSRIRRFLQLTLYTFIFLAALGALIWFRWAFH